MRRTVLSALALACGAVLASTAPAFADGASATPTRAPSAAPSAVPSATKAPTQEPSDAPSRSASTVPSAEPSAAPARGRGQVAVVPSGAPDTGVAPASKSSGDLTTGLAGGEPPRWSSAAPSSSYGAGGRPAYDLALQARLRHRGDGDAARRLRRRERDDFDRELRYGTREFGQEAVHTPAPPAGRAAHALARSVPVTLRVPAIGVDTPVMRLGLASDGTVQVPPITAHDRAGWYRNSPTPGQTGPSVILGHVTVGAYGDGVFRHLAKLRRGDRIEAGLENGTTATFTVTTVRTVAKADFPSDEVYGNVDRPELRLITCGGTRTGTGYLDNVIVFAALTA